VITIFAIIGFVQGKPTGIMSMGDSIDRQMPLVFHSKELAQFAFNRMKKIQLHNGVIGEKGDGFRLMEFKQHEILEEFFPEQN